MTDLVDEQVRQMQLRALRAKRASLEERKELLFDNAEEVLNALLDNENLTEDELVVLAERKDLSVELLRRLGNDTRVQASYKIKRTLLFNPKTPPSVSLKLINQLFTFDVMAVTLLPAIPREVKTAAEEYLCRKLTQLSLGERLTLARRTNCDRVLTMLLDDNNKEVVGAALTNSFLREGTICATLRKATVKPHTVELIALNAKWSCRYDVRYALLRTRHISLGLALNFLSMLTPADLRDLAADPNVPMQLRSYIKKNLDKLNASRGQKTR
ncbi:MAG: hypothetical protein AB1489_21085 [Acidobacteriota bacterium]